MTPKAPKTSQLGWDMDHVWLLRDGAWTLEGEWRSATGAWRTASGRVEIGDNTARYILADEEGPQRLLRLEKGRANRQAFKVEVHTESVTLVGSVRSFGLRQDLTAAAGNWNMAETALQRSDGSVEVDGIFARLGDVHDAWRWILRPEALDEVWTVPRSVVEGVEAAARGGAPIEQCGLLIGVAAERRIVSQVQVTNVDQSEDHFTMSPAERLEVEKSLRGGETAVVGGWHSHPFSPARPSDEDVKLSDDESLVYGLASVMEDSKIPFNLFRIQNGIATPVKLVVLEG
jgi:[CysO sulfur-carrier protein]-S-L-cysteine hydrolase